MTEKNDHIKIKARKEIYSANMLEVEVGTTGPCGGDAGHGGFTYLRLKDLGSTAMEVQVNGREVDPGEGVQEVVLRFLGDSEMQTFKEALRFALGALDLE